MSDAVTFPHFQSPPSTRQSCVGGRVMSSQSKSTNVPKQGTNVPVSREEASERMFAFLRKVYPNKTLEHVASDLGISVETVAKWRSRKSLPGFLTAFQMSLIYGPEFFYTVAPEMARSLNDRMDRDRAALKS